VTGVLWRNLTLVRADARKREWFACNGVGMRAVSRAPLNEALEGTSLPRELIFLVSAPPPEAGIEAGVPVRIKATKSGGKDPQVAFASEELGRQLIAGRQLNGHVSLLPFSKLATDEAQNAKKRSILLFERPEQVAGYLDEGHQFNFLQLMVSFKDAVHKLQSAL
jgi:hypothetical protein